VQKTLQEIVDFIAGTRRELLAAADGLTPRQLDYQPGPDRWSIGQLLEHVAATEARMGGKMAQSAAQALERGLPAREPGVVDLAIFVELRTRVAGVRFQAPREVVPSGGLGLAELVARLESARQRLLDLLPLLAAHDMTSVGFPHPLLGDNFNLYQWLFFMGVHETRHRRQVESVKQEAGFPKG
jgi:uncharacterized damage-inducible protein DinB